MKISLRIMTIAGISVLFAAGASAEVQHSSPDGFVVKHVVIIEAPVNQVFATLHRDVGAWWHPDHTFSGDSKRLSIDLKAGGCLCEELPDGGGVQHLEVVYVEPNHRIRFTGGLGPLQEMAVSGSMTWEVVKSESGSEFTWTYTVGGYYHAGIENLAGPVDSVLGDQLMRMKNYVEKGTPTP